MHGNLMSLRVFFSVLSVSLLCVAASPSLQAGQAILSADGSTAWVISSRDASLLHRIDTKNGGVSSVALSGPLESMEVYGLCRLLDGGVAAIAAGAVWEWSDFSLNSKPSKIVDLPESFSATDIACIPHSSAGDKGLILLFGSDGDLPDSKIISFIPGKKGFGEVFCRRFSPSALPSISPENRLFFGGDFDLWEGQLESPDADDEDIVMPVNGCRIAPLAMRNSDSGNSGSMGVSTVAAGGKHVYALLSGPHMGGVLAISPSEKPLYLTTDQDTHPDLKDALAIQQASLGSARVLYQGGPCDALCSTVLADGTDVVLWQEAGKDWIWIYRSADEKPRLLIGGE